MGRAGGQATRGELVAPEDPTWPLTVHDLSANLTTVAYLPYWAEFSTGVLALHEGGAAARMSTGGDNSLCPTAFTAITCADQDFRVRTYAEYAALTRLVNQISPRTTGSLRCNRAITGCLGQSTGPHLDFEVWNPRGQKINPLTWLDQHGVTV